VGTWRFVGLCAARPQWPDGMYGRPVDGRGSKPAACNVTETHTWVQKAATVRLGTDHPMDPVDGSQR